MLRLVHTLSVLSDNVTREVCKKLLLVFNNSFYFLSIAQGNAAKVKHGSVHFTATEQDDSIPSPFRVCR